MLAIVTVSEVGILILAAMAMTFVGGIPFGFLIGWIHGIDVRKAGSGNIGATNVGRLCGRFWGVLTLLLDAAKGFVPCLVIAPWLGARLVPGVPHAEVVMQVVFGMGAIFGHMFPVYLKFKGGKGIATAAGVFLAASPWALLCAFLAWLIFTAVTRYVSIGSIASVIALAGGQAITDPEAFRNRFGVTLFAIGTAVIAIWKHRGNILRLIQGTEPKIKLGQKKPADEPGGAA